MKTPNIVMLAVSIVVLAGLARVGGARADMATSAHETTPIGVGGSVPDASLRTLEGEAVSLREAVAGRPTVLIFYRGGWCPFCTRHLSELQTQLPRLRALGYQLLAISPDPPEDLQPAIDEGSLGYTLLSDHDMHAADAFGLAFAVDEDTLKSYEGYGITLKAKRDGRYWLPVPAVYLVDGSGKLAFSHSDPDYKRRIAMSALLEAADPPIQR